MLCAFLTFKYCPESGFTAECVHIRYAHRGVGEQKSSNELVRKHLRAICREAHTL